MSTQQGQGKTKVFIIDDEKMVAGTLKDSLQKAGYEVVGENYDFNFTNVKNSLKNEPDIIILDILEGEHGGTRNNYAGIDLAKRLIEEGQYKKIVFISGAFGDENPVVLYKVAELVNKYNNLTFGYFSKCDDNEELKKIISDVSQGRISFSPICSKILTDMESLYKVQKAKKKFDPFRWFKEESERLAWGKYVYPTYFGKVKEITPGYISPNLDVRNWFYALRYGAKNLIALIGFFFFILYVELFFWYAGFFGIFGKDLRNLFSFYKGPFDLILLPFSMAVYGERDIFAWAISLAFVLEFFILFSLSLVQNRVKKFYEESEKKSEMKKSTVKWIRVGLFLTLLAVIVEYTVMATFAYKAGLQFGFPKALFYVLIVIFPVLEILTTRGIETYLFLVGTNQDVKEYIEEILRGIDLAL